MESLAYIHLVLASDHPPQFHPFSALNGGKLSSQGYLHFLSLGLILSLLFVADSAHALQLTDRGESVRQVQSRLKSLGYFNATTTGYFGTITQTAVKQFQRANGLTPDGIVGPQTMNALMGNPLDKFNPISQNNLTIGSRGQSVSQLQQGLFQLGYLRGVNVTGLFDFRTRIAVQQFQQNYRLRTDGIADRATLNALNTSLSSSNLPVEESPQDTVFRNLVLGDTGAPVESLQTLLKTRGYFTSNITGYFGTITETAVKRFQRDQRLPITGIVNRQTLNLLKGNTDSIVSVPTSTWITLRRGNQGFYVRQLQLRLQALNYYSGSINGVFGRETEYAVFQFQRDYSLNPTGVASPDTLSTLQLLIPSLS